MWREHPQVHRGHGAGLCGAEGQAGPFPHTCKEHSLLLLWGLVHSIDLFWELRPECGHQQGPRGFVMGRHCSPNEPEERKGTQETTLSVTLQLQPQVQLSPQLPSETSWRSRPERGEQDQRKVGEGLQNGQGPLCKMLALRSNLFSPSFAPSSRKPSLTTAVHTIFPLF